MATPTPSNQTGQFHWSIHFMSFPVTFFLAEKPPPPPDIRENSFTLNLSISCNFQQLWFFCGRKAIPPGWGKIFLYWIYPFYAISSNFGFCGRKAPPPLLVDLRENILTLNLSISCNFQQLWFFCGRKAPLPRTEGIFCLHWIYQFHAISSNFGFFSGKAPPPPPMNIGGKIWFTLNLSISCNLLSNFVHPSGRKAPPPPQNPQGKKIYTESIHFMQFPATLVNFAGRKASPPQNQDKGKFF